MRFLTKRMVPTSMVERSGLLFEKMSRRKGYFSDVPWRGAAHILTKKFLVWLSRGVVYFLEIVFLTKLPFFSSVVGRSRVLFELRLFD